jgi:hypothetical protein
MARALVASLFTAALVGFVTPVAAQETSIQLVTAAQLPASPRVLELQLVEPPSATTPTTVKALFGSYAVLQGLDLYSTSVALKAGAREANPLMQRSTGQAVAIKAALGVTTYYMVNKMSKKNRKGAIVTMAILNGVTAAVVANNLKNSRR